MHQPATDRLLRSRAVQERYGITDRTLDHWLADPELGFPQPLIINRLRYFREAELASWERQRAAETASAA
jgi:predicted DNA-binding transcriptional regulator AlpA